MKRILALGFLVLVMASGNAKAEERHHEHTAPHGGTLVVFGEEFAHLELALDSQEGRLTGYVLDGEAEDAVRIGQVEIDLEISVNNSADGKTEEADFSLKLKAISNVLTGETEGDTSEFAGQSDKLKGATNFDGVITAITIKDKQFESVPFSFPEGNE